MLIVHSVEFAKRLCEFSTMCFEHSGDSNDALLVSVFEGNMNYCPKSEDGVRGLRLKERHLPIVSILWYSL